MRYTAELRAQLQKMGAEGGKAAAENMSAEARRRRAQKAAAARWSK